MLLILRVVSLGMNYYGIIGAILFLLFTIPRTVEILLEKRGIYKTLTPFGWDFATWEIWAIGILWAWILAGFIYVLNPKYLPGFVFTAMIDPHGIKGMALFLINIIILLAYLQLFFINLVTLGKSRETVDVKIINPVKIEK